MDTTTVLKVINIIDNQIDYYRRNSSQDGFGNIIEDFPQGQEDSLVRLRSHLQSFIEAELTKAENNTVE